MAENGKDPSVRNSTGKLKVTAKGVDIGPNYLRASTGSCHDACKYGTPHVFKSRPKHPVRRSSISNAEIPIEIFTASDKRVAKPVKPSSVAPDASVSTKLEVPVSRRLSSIDPPKSIRQQAPSSSKVRSKQIGQETRLNVKSLSPNVLDSIKQDSSLDLKSLSPDLANLGKEESSLEMNSLSPDSLKSTNHDSSFCLQTSSPDSLISAKQESSLDVKSSPSGPPISVKQESSSDVKPPSLKKGSSSRRQSVSALKLPTVLDVQSRRKSSLSNVSALSPAQSSTKPARHSLHLMPGSSSKTKVVDRKSSSLDALKSVKREGVSSNGKAPLKNEASTKLGGFLKSKSTRVKTEQSSSPNLLGSSSGKRKTGIKIDSDSRTAASKKKIDSPTTSLSLRNRKSPQIAVKNTLASSTVTRLNVRNNITKKEGSSRKAEASSSSKKPGNEKVPEKTLHMIEAESSNQKSDDVAHNGSDIIQSPLLLSPVSCDSPFSSQDAIETNSESEYTDSEADDTVSNSRRVSGKGKMVDQESEAVKLKFRRGKVVEPQSESNSSRRLRYKKKTVSGNDQSVSNDRKVVLRHQDLQEKSEQGLLNVVIEETVSKLVESRKSKVKALVGAFESVISLQESRSSPNSSP